MTKIAVFASGSGSNAQRIYEYFSNNLDVNINLILTNNKDAFVIERAKKIGVERVIFNRDQFYKSDFVLELLKKKQIDFIILAGFLWLIPINIINQFPAKIINIHPALLPKYGGKGMYGMNVHKAVKENNEAETGITIHYVNEKYDDGAIIFQAKCEIESFDTPESIAQKIHTLEHKHFPEVIESVIKMNANTSFEV
jgi:phosphoribosylglycinamide formyltransferase 1